MTRQLGDPGLQTEQAPSFIRQPSGSHAVPVSPALVYTNSSTPQYWPATVADRMAPPHPAAAQNPMLRPTISFMISVVPP
jgi:hypothetical protein